MDNLALRKVIVTQLGLDDVDDVKDEMRIGKDLDADSMDVVELIMAFEEEFRIEIPDPEWESLWMDPTVGQIQNFLEAHGA